MEITVQMTEAEYSQFIAWRDDKSINEREARKDFISLIEEYRLMCHALINAVEISNDKLTVISNNQLQRALLMAEEYFME